MTLEFGKPILGTMPDDADGDELLNAPQVAALLQVTDETVRRWTDSKKLRHIRLPSGARRYRRSDVEAILNPVEPEVVA